MWNDLLPLIAGLTIAVVIYVARELHRRRTEVHPARPDITLEEARLLWVGGGASLPSHLVEPLRLHLAALEEELQGALHPRLRVRSEIMAATATAIHLETIAALGEEERKALIAGYREGMGDALGDFICFNSAAAAVLRFYTGLKYDDAVPRDWLDQFRWTAGPYIREKVRLAREFVLEMNEGAGRFVEVYDSLLNELRKDLLGVPPKRRFVPPDFEVR